jgi:hypothetical protein
MSASPAGESPCVCRRSRRLSAQLPSPPTARVASAVSTMPGTAVASSAPMASTVTPADTSATTCPSPSSTGPVARTDGPRVPV